MLGGKQTGKERRGVCKHKPKRFGATGGKLIREGPKTNRERENRRDVKDEKNKDDGKEDMVAL